MVGAEMTVALLQAQIFDLSFNLHPWLWLLGPVAGGLLSPLWAISVVEVYLMRRR